MNERQFHPVADLFPLMVGTAFDELVNDIQANGLREPIWLFDEQIIDGRNRYNACLKSGVSPEYRDWQGNGNGDLTKFVVSLNLHRRHLSESQRAMVASKIATRDPRSNCAADRKDTQPGPNLAQVVLPPTCQEAGEMLNVSKHSVKTARKVRREGIPEVIEAVESGKLSLHSAEKIIAEPRETQASALIERQKPKAERKPAPTNGKATYTKRHTGRKAPEAVRGAIGTLVTLATGLDSFTVKDASPTPAEAKEWERDLLAVISAVNRFRRQLREHDNGEA